MAFIKENDRNLSVYNLKGRWLYTWLNHQRKMITEGGMKKEQVAMSEKPLEIGKMYRLVN